MQLSHKTAARFFIFYLLSNKALIFFLELKHLIKFFQRVLAKFRDYLSEGFFLTNYALFDFSCESMCLLAATAEFRNYFIGLCCVRAEKPKGYF